MKTTMDSVKDIVGRKTSTPQMEQALPNQIVNDAGGYVFDVGLEQKLRRYMILGSEDGTYYASAKSHTKRNVEMVMKAAETNPGLLLKVIEDVSLGGLAPKQEGTLLALAVAASTDDPDVNRKALDLLPKVARTGEMLFQFISFVTELRGWGRGLRNGVANWYTSKDADALAYQVVKYRQRAGWTHRDLLRLSHPKWATPSKGRVFEWITKGNVGDGLPSVLEGYLKASEADIKDLPQIIKDYRLTWEMVPTTAHKSVPVWEALLENKMPMTALIRNLPRLSSLGMTSPMSDVTKQIVAQLGSEEALKKARVHPIRILKALRGYSSGGSRTLSFDVNQDIVDALDAAFYKTFSNATPANKRTLIGMDVSGSMSFHNEVDGMFTPLEVSVAMAMVNHAIEPETAIMGFSNRFVPLKISSKRSLNENLGSVRHLPFGGTDCAKPMEWALQNKIPVDTFLIYTDNETWGGSQHPFQALEKYRQGMGIDSKFIVAGVTATDSTITNPDDPGSMSVVGFDPSIPDLISNFSAGRI